MKANWRSQFSILSRNEQLCRRQWKRCRKRLVIQMRSLCLLDKSTWMLTDLQLSQSREAEQKTKGRTGSFCPSVEIWHCHLHCTCLTVAKWDRGVVAVQIRNRFPGEESFFLVHRSALHSKMTCHNTQEKPTSVCTVHCKDVKILFFHKCF